MCDKCNKQIFFPNSMEKKISWLLFHLKNITFYLLRYNYYSKVLFFFVSLGQHKWRKKKQVCCWKLNLIGRIESRFLKLLDNWWGTQNPKWLAEKKVTKNRSLGPAAAASANSYGQHTIVNDGQVGPKPNHFISIIEIVFSPLTLRNFFSNPRNSFISTGVFIVVLYRYILFYTASYEKRQKQNT